MWQYRLKRRLNWAKVCQEAKQNSDSMMRAGSLNGPIMKIKPVKMRSRLSTPLRSSSLSTSSSSGSSSRHCFPYCSYFLLGMICFLCGTFLGSYYLLLETTPSIMLRNDSTRDNDEVPKREFTDGPVVSSQHSFSFSHPLSSLPSSAPLVPSLFTPTIRPSSSSHNQIHTRHPVKAITVTDPNGPQRSYPVKVVDLDTQERTRLPTISSTLSLSSSVLIIGGTDGSGTRRVVQVLTELGVSMVSEDPETYDIHADLVKGWPPLVNPVINHFKSLDYDISKSPPFLLSQTRQSVGRLLEQVL